MTTRSHRLDPSAWMIVLIAIILLVKLVDIKKYRSPEKVIAWDAISYYSYLPATFIEGDYTLAFVLTDTAYYRHYWPEVTADGRCIIKTTMGLSILYSPFFFAAHAVALHTHYAADGYSPPYALALLLAAVVYAVLGCCFLRRVLIAHFSRWTAAITMGIVVIATNLLWYISFEGAYSHVYSFALVCLFLFLTERWYDRPNAWRSLAAGLTLGMIALVRPTNVLVALYFLLYDAGSIQQLGQRAKCLWQRWPLLLLMAASAVAAWVPQMLYWHALTGHFLYFSYTGERFFWTDPKILHGLVGFRKGWLIYTPVMIFALLGLVPLWKRARGLAVPIIVFTAANLYVVFSWWCWWYGGSFGQRTLIDSYGIMAIPLAAFWEWMLHRKAPLRAGLMAVFVAVVLLSHFHIRQYRHLAIHYDSMTRAAYFDSFGHKRPSERFYSLLAEPDYEAARAGQR